MGAFLSLGAAAIVALTTAGGPTPEPSRDAELGRPSPDLSRIAAVRVFQGGHYPIRGETPRSIARTLSSLDPTFLMAPLRYAAGDPVAGREQRAWRLLREKVLRANPGAQFAISLNAIQYRSRRAVLRKMAYLRKRLEPDAWLFDLYTRATRRRAHVMRTAVASAHRNGELIGGNVFGITLPQTIPGGTDYVSVQGIGFRINMPAVRRLARRFPVIVQLGNSPKYARSDGCRWIRELSNGERRRYVAQRAGEQRKYRFRFAYPVFFPECNAHLNTPRQRLFAYNATEDPGMMRLIRRLMNKYD